MICQLAFFMLLLFTDSKLFVDCAPNIGKQCCLEDWNKHVGKVIDTFKISKSLTSKEFLTEFDRWNTSHRDFLNNEPKGICNGYLSYMCNVKSKLCECSNDISPFQYTKGTGHLSQQWCFGDGGAFCLEKAADCKEGFMCVPNKAVANGRFHHCVVDPTFPTPAPIPGQKGKSGCDSNVPSFTNIGLFQFTIILILIIFS